MSRIFPTTLLILALAGAACSCESNAKLVSREGEPGGGGEGGGGWGGTIFLPGGKGGEGGAGGDGGEGGVVEGPEPTLCERACGRLAICGLEVSGLDRDCLLQCQQSLLDEEKRCLATVACTMEEALRCLGREPVLPDEPEEPLGHRCDELCPFVYDQCGRSMVDVNHLQVYPADCASRCPQLPDAYLDCLEAASTCPAVDLCQPEAPPPPPTACEQMCGNVYGTCGRSIDQPGRSYSTEAACVAACEGGAFSESERDCLRYSACEALDACFPRQPTSCEVFCDWFYDDCNNAFPLGGHKEDKIDKDACVERCEDGRISQAQRGCLEAETCEYAATCIRPSIDRECAAACYWIHAWCGFYNHLQRLYGGVPYADYHLKAEEECQDFCEYGFWTEGVLGPEWEPNWSPARKACYRQRASAREADTCDSSNASPYGMSFCSNF